MEKLYNGIVLPDEWPPSNIEGETGEPMPVPCLVNTPDTIPIHIGRQLFVDDFLIEKCDMSRRFHQAQKYHGNPIFSPQTPLEINGRNNPCAMPVSGGIWWDPFDSIYKMWYEAGWMHTLAYAVSNDGIVWERPNLDIEPGTNRILDDRFKPDSSTVFIDYDTPDPDQRYKLFIREPNRSGRYTLSYPDEKKKRGGMIFTSADGVHWKKQGRTGPMRDRSTIFYNPFRKKWVYSIKSNAVRDGHRTRHYWEHSDFVKGRKWGERDPVFWAAADKLDLPDPYIRQATQLYNLDAVAYESIMLGVYQIHKGPKNIECMEYGVPKITELILAFSRDGFHWDRPKRTPFIGAERRESCWDRGHIQSVGGVCLVVRDHLYFYYTGIGGDSSRLKKHISQNGMYAHGSTGLAILRRDGFASLEALDRDGVVITKKVLFHQGKYLFVNVDNPQGVLRAEILNDKGKPIEPFTLENCVPVSKDSTCQRIRWKGQHNLSHLAGRPIKFKFHMKDGQLYSFWVSDKIQGVSHGFLGAGAPGYPDFVDR